MSWRRPLLIMAAILGLAAAARAQSDLDVPLPPGLLEDERNTIDIFRRMSKSVVFVTNKQLRRDIFTRNEFEVPAGSGSGFIWDADGHVVTNFHVVADGSSFTVTLGDKKEYDAELVGVEPFKDLAVLKIQAPKSMIAELKFVEPGDSDRLIVGQKVVAIGNPFGLDQTLTTGVISALGREIKSMRNTTIHDVIQTDASINPGNSGGPLLDSGGRLIGVNTAIFSTSGASAGIGFAVPVSVVKRVVPQLIARGRVTRAGIGIVPFSDDVGRRFGGLPIQDVPPRGGAARAGLKGATMDRYGRVQLGDVILAVDGKKITTFDDLYLALEDHKPGDSVRVRYRRGERELEANVVLQAIE